MLTIGDNRRSTQLMLAAADAAILVAAAMVAAWIRFGGGLFAREVQRIAEHPAFIAYAVLAQLTLALTFDLYRPESWRTRDYVLARVPALGATFAVALAPRTYLVPGWRFGRGLLAL